MNFKILLIIFGTLLYSTTATAEADRAFAEIMQQKVFRVQVSKDNVAKQSVDTLLISCFDFRLRDETERFMRLQLNLLDNYDEIALPGASLAVANSRYPEWVKTTKDAISMLKSLHKIKRVIFLDHRECGVYNMLLGKANLDTRDKETHAHTRVLAEAMRAVKKDFPDMEVYALLMGLDGVVENITKDVLLLAQ